MSEAFFLLSGTVEFHDGNGWTSRRRNDFVYVPPGGIHGWHNESDEPAAMLVLFAPGAPRTQFFEGLAHLGELTDDERREWFARHDNVYIEQRTPFSANCPDFCFASACGFVGAW
jgi:hypothetical protein